MSFNYIFDSLDLNDVAEYIVDHPGLLLREKGWAPEYLYFITNGVVKFKTDDYGVERLFVYGRCNTGQDDPLIIREANIDIIYLVYNDISFYADISKL